MGPTLFVPFTKREPTGRAEEGREDAPAGEVMSERKGMGGEDEPRKKDSFWRPNRVRGRERCLRFLTNEDSIKRTGRMGKKSGQVRIGPMKAWGSVCLGGAMAPGLANTTLRGVWRGRLRPDQGSFTCYSGAREHHLSD